MKLLVACIDGADYDFIHRNRLNNFLQTHTYKLTIPRSAYHPTLNSPWTPLVWPTILSGREHDYDLLKNKNTFTCPSPTFLDLCDSINIDVPTTREHPWKLHQLEGYANFKDLMDRQKTKYYDRNQRIRAAVRTDSDLIVFYLNILDIAAHLNWTDRDLMLALYLVIDQFIGAIKPDNTPLIIVSDHGFKDPDDGKGGVHSDYAFLSTNFDLDREPKSTLDVYNIVKHIL